jgi:N-acetylglucosamine kinase-like BadF-type ATPase
MLVGIDIGGTKTEILASAGAERFSIVLPTGDWRSRADGRRDADKLVAAVLDLTGGRQPDVVVAGAHGCDADEDCERVQAWLARALIGTVLVLNDSELLLPAAGKQRGISVISGTGSIAVARSGDRHMLAAGGWGWFLGDEGSASGLVREAARAVRASLDAGETLELLGRNLLAAVDVGNPVELGRRLGEFGAAASIGRFASVIFDAADAGSPLALKVITDGGRALATLTERLVARGAHAGDVVTGGGVISRQPRLFQAFQTALAETLPALSLTLLTESPVTGALALARDLQAGRHAPSLPFPHIAGRRSGEQDWRAA